jgi:flavodoxin
MPGILIVYYSRTGYTRRVAEELAAKTGATMEALAETRSRSGVFNYLRSGREALTGRTAPICPTVQDPSAFDLVVLGSPVWAGHVCSPMRTYLTERRDDLPNVAFFCTQHASGADKALRDMTDLAGREPVVTLALNDRVIRSGAYRADVARFAEQILATTPQPGPSSS